MVRDDVQRVAAVLARPHRRFRADLDRARQAVYARSPDAARQLEMFSGRIADLTVGELRELHDETFGGGRDPAAGQVIRRLERSSTGMRRARSALDALAPLLDRLDADRNPLAYVVRALCCVLFERLRPARRARPPAS